MPDWSDGFEELLLQAGAYLPEEALSLLKDAYLFAWVKHAPKKRESGEPYIVHPVAVASYLAGMRLDIDTLRAALLHDVVEDTPTSLKTLESRFGSDVANLVDGVTKLKKRASQATQAGNVLANLGKMLQATASDLRVLLIKLADRRHNMLTLEYVDRDKQIRKAEEALAFYAPLAARLGIWKVKTQLENLALQMLYPAEEKELRDLVAQHCQASFEKIQLVTKALQEGLQPSGIRCQIQVLEPHRYALFEESRNKKRKSSELEIPLEIAFLVPRVEDCYCALHLIHALWTPIPGKFDDYIVFPKENFYKSLHTSVIGPGGALLKVRIRTPEMHDRAELGVFVEWKFASAGSPTELPVNQLVGGQLAWWQQLRDWHHLPVAPIDTLDLLRTSILAERIWVFTPKGKKIELPENATVLDFAYQIHSTLGDTCRGARVNGVFKTMDTQLHNGDRVEVLKVAGSQPDYDWLDPHLRYCITLNARNSITRWFRSRPVNIKLENGKQIIARELEILGIPDTPLEKIAALFKRPNVHSLLLSVGNTTIRSDQIAEHLLDAEKPGVIQIERGSWLPEQGKKVHGIGKLPQRFADCCYPLPGFQIAGELTIAGVVIIHRADCPTLLKLQASRPQIRLSWENEPAQIFPYTVEVQANEGEGLLKDITSIIMTKRVNISEVHIITDKENNRANLAFTLDIRSSREFVGILHQINHLPNVLNAYRKLFIPLVN